MPHLALGGFGAAFDFGGTVIYPKPIFGGTLRFGAVERNVGSSMGYLQQKDPLPTHWKLGLNVPEAV